MSIALVVNGSTYNYPQTNDVGWGDNATNWASAVTSSMLQLTGGTFQLSAEVDFGTAFGLKSLYYKSRTTSPASAGQIRLANTDTIKWRDNANAADIALNPKTSDNSILQYASLDLVNVSSTQTLTNKIVGTANRAVQTNSGTGVLETSSVTTTELGYLSGVTSAIQTQITNTVGKGIIIGGLNYPVSNTVPPVVRAGIYECNGLVVSKTADVTMTGTDTIQQCRQTFESYLQYLVVMDNSGNTKYIPYGEGAVAGATGNITSITGAGTTKTIAVATGTTSAGDVGKILVIEGNDGVNGVFKIASRLTAPERYTFESVSTVTGTNVGTWTVYERINTFHGAGSATAVTTDANVLYYTPSYGENGWSAGIVAWDATKNGFYLNLSGLTAYRVIGNFRTDGSSHIIDDIISHNPGRDKNDNWVDVNTSPATPQGSTNTAIAIYSTIVKMFGCDYTYVTSATNGDKWTMNSYIDFSGQCGLQTTVPGWSLNSSQLTTSILSINASDRKSYSSGTYASSSAYLQLKSGDIMRVHTDTGASAGAAQCNIRMKKL